MSTFHILHPARIPTPDWVQCTVSAELLQALSLLAGCERWNSNREAAESYRASIAGLQNHFSDDGFDIAELDTSRDVFGGSRDDNAHDQYFAIRRSGAPATPVFLETVLRANLILFEDCWTSPFTIAPSKLDCLDLALISLLLWTIGALPSGTMYTDARIRGWMSLGDSYNSMTRWIGGHQIFAALTQGLTAVFRDLKEALQDKDEKRIGQAVDLAVLLLDGSAVSLEFTGDFPSVDYTGIIRPSMDTAFSSRHLQRAAFSGP